MPELHPPAHLSPPPPYLQKHEFSKESKDLIASLPTEKGWVTDYLYQYQGFWHTARQLKGVLSCQTHFHAQPSDIFLVTTPKSGTTWLKALAFAAINRVRFANQNRHPLLTDNPHVLVPFLELQYIDKESVDFTNYESPRLFSTHLPIGSLPTSVDEQGCKVVYLCRNPKDTLVSFWHFTNRLRPKEKGENSLEEVFGKFCKGVSLYGPFWDHVLGYWKRSLESPDRVLFLKYEEMKEEPRVHLKKLCQFLGCPFSEEEEAGGGMVDEILKLCSFEHLSNLEVNKMGRLPSGEENRAFFRRGEVGDSMNYLTPEMLRQMEEITEQKLHEFGLKW